MAIDLLRAAYNTKITDDFLVTATVDIFAEVMTRKHNDKEPLSVAYTVGELRKTKGFWASDFIVTDMVGGLIGRSVRMLTLLTGGNLLDPEILALLVETDEQQARVVPLVKARAIATFGEPPYIDEKTIEGFKKRYRKLGVQVD